MAGRGQVVLVTGCRSGFGLLAAVELARRGHVVYAGLRDLETAGPLRQAAAGLPVHPLQLDVTSPADREQAIARILGEQGRLDALVNNAGVALGGFQEQLGEDEVRRVLEINVVSVWALTALALPHLRARQGAICNVSSVAGRIALPGLGLYAASKHALEGMTEALRHELRPFGVRVTLVEPGPYATDIMERNRAVCRRMHEADGPYLPWVRRGEELEARVHDRLGDPAEVAARIADVIEAPAPRLRHPLGWSAKLRLLFRWLLPFSAWEAVVARVMRPRAGQDAQRR